MYKKIAEASHIFSELSQDLILWTTLKLLCAKIICIVTKVAGGHVSQLIELQSICLSRYGLFKVLKKKKARVDTNSISGRIKRKGPDYGGAFVFLIWCLKLRGQINVAWQVRLSSPLVQENCSCWCMGCEWNKKPSTRPAHCGYTEWKRCTEKHLLRGGTFCLEKTWLYLRWNFSFVSITKSYY